MDGVHDMGGMDGFGPVEPESDEPIFHAQWEGRMLALTRAMGCAAGWTIDMQRFSREQVTPHLYLAASYYQRWMLAMQQMLLDHGLVGADEFAAGHALRRGEPLKRGPFTLADVPRVMKRASFGRVAGAPARFKVGDGVRARNMHPRMHTRLPRYVRGHTGIIERVQGCCVFPDVAARGDDEDPQWLYTVTFEGTELWGADADPSLRVSVEAFEPYLEPA